MMRWAVIGLLTVHGLIHLMGFAKAFGYADLPQLSQPISREWGVLWLLAWPGDKGDQARLQGWRYDAARREVARYPGSI